MSDIVLSSGIRSNLLTLQRTAQLQEDTQLRLATGKKVNSALDNPTNFFSAALLNGRANDLQKLLDTVGNATRTLEAADNGITAITKLVENLQATALQALQLGPPVSPAATATGTLNFGTDAAASTDIGDGALGTLDDTEVSNLSANITINGTTITFADGAGGEITTVAGLEAAIDAIAGVSANTVGGVLTITADNVETAITFGGDAATLTSIGGTSVGAGDILGRTAITNDQTLTIQTPLGTQTITFGRDAGEVNTVAELTAALTAFSDADEGFTAVLNNGNIQVTAANNASTITFGGTARVATGLPATATPGAADSPQRDALVTQYNDLRAQINQLASDSSYNGINLINGDDLIVVFNEDNTSTLTVNGVDLTTTGLGITEVTTNGFDVNANIQVTLDELNAALGTLRTQASTFGANLSVVETRNDFIGDMIKTLETGATNLVIADTNEEGANLLALQTRQQLSSTALSLAAQAEQNVLRLFG